MVSADPDDDVVVYTAIGGHADVICTLDRHLREPDVIQFCSRRRIRVLTDLALLAELEARIG